MSDFIENYQYTIAWVVYIFSGIIFSLFWWKVTSLLAHAGWREALRGIALVLIFMPWFTDGTHDHLAPAFVVVLLDLLIGTSDNGLTGSLALLSSLAVMLMVLIARRFFLPEVTIKRVKKELFVGENRLANSAARRYIA